VLLGKPLKKMHSSRIKKCRNIKRRRGIGRKGREDRIKDKIGSSSENNVEK
jgi:hypothetical protein